MEPAACPYNRPCAENNDNNDTNGHSRGDNNANRESLYSYITPTITLSLENEPVTA